VSPGLVACSDRCGTPFRTGRRPRIETRVLRSIAIRCGLNLSDARLACRIENLDYSVRAGKLPVRSRGSDRIQPFVNCRNATGTAGRSGRRVEVHRCIERSAIREAPCICSHRRLAARIVTAVVPKSATYRVGTRLQRASMVTLRGCILERFGDDRIDLIFVYAMWRAGPGRVTESFEA